MNLVVAVIVLLGAMLCAELYLRATIPSSSGGSVFESTLTTKRYKVMKRNARIVVYGAEFRTNELGFRDSKSHVALKRPSAFRVIVLGDSFTASAGVDFKKIYTSVLETEIRESILDVEVINLAVGGYNIIQYAMVLEEVGLALRPDLVIVAVFPFNDLSNDTYRANYDNAVGRARPTSQSWYQELYVYRAFLGRVEARVRSWFRPPASSAQEIAQDDELKRDAEENLAALNRIVQIATERDIGVLVALLPNTDVFEQQRKDFVPFEALCNARHWNCLNLLDQFIMNGDHPASLRLNTLDSHPNERYNTIMAKLMTDYLRPYIEAQRALGTKPY